MYFLLKGNLYILNQNMYIMVFLAKKKMYVPFILMDPL